MIQSAITSLMEAGTAAGALRSDIRPTDMFAALAGHRPHFGEARASETKPNACSTLTLDGLSAAPSHG